MSTTSTTVSARPLTTASLPTAFAETCQKCGADVSDLQNGIAEEAQQRIRELEQQVRILTDKATAAVDKLADYEDQLHQLRSQTKPLPQATKTSYTSNPSSPYPQSEPPNAAQARSRPTTPNDIPTRPTSGISRLSALLPSSTRRSASQPPTASMPNTPFPHAHTPLAHTSFPPSGPPSNTSSAFPSALPTPMALHAPSSTPTTTHPHQPDPNAGFSHTDLLNALTHETNLRHAAEARLSETNNEVEELTSSLFTEANEMVAKERKAAKRLEDRLNELEVKAKAQEALEKKIREKDQRLEVLERRAREKDERLEGLERRVLRGERVRGLLSQGIGGAGAAPGNPTPATGPTVNGI